MQTDKGHGMEECAADSREQRDLRRVLMNDSEKRIPKRRV